MGRAGRGGPKLGEWRQEETTDLWIVERGRLAAALASRTALAQVNG